MHAVAQTYHVRGTVRARMLLFFVIVMDAKTCKKDNSFVDASYWLAYDSGFVFCVEVKSSTNSVWLSSLFVRLFCLYCLFVLFVLFVCLVCLVFTLCSVVCLVCFFGFVSFVLFDMLLV